MFQWRSARRTSGEKEGTWQEKVPSSAGEGRGGGLHFICTPTHTSPTHFVNGVSSCFIYTLYFFTHPPMLMSTLPPASPTHVDVHAAPCPTHPCFIHTLYLFTSRTTSHPAMLTFTPPPPNHVDIHPHPTQPC